MRAQKYARQQLQNEINDFTLYTLLARHEKDPHNREIFQKIAHQELSHYKFCQKITQSECKAQSWFILFYTLLIKILGTTFTLKFMESREANATKFYLEIEKEYPEARYIYEEEQQHEKELLSILTDKTLTNAGGIVLGMNDALVELTGTLSGIALAFDKPNIVGATGLIMGVAASLSMAGSAYLESKENPSAEIKPATYALYTGCSYILTTLLLILPFFIFEHVQWAVGMMFTGALITILLYNFYISVAKDLKFWPRVREMCTITFGVAIISFAIGLLVKYYFGLNI